MAISLVLRAPEPRAAGASCSSDQSIEEAQHAQKIMDFLTDNEVDFDLPALKAASTRFGSA